MKFLSTTINLLCAALILAVSSDGARAGEAKATALVATPMQVKAAYLYNFSLFVEWPSGSFESDTSDIRLCVLGDDPFGNLLEQTLRDRQAKGRKFNIRRSKSPQELLGCHILYVSPSGGNHEQLRKITGANTLIVGDAPGLAEKGAILNFFTEDQRIRFEVNIASARKSGFIISARMLQVARMVGEDAGGGQ
ncbi:MAG: YfiR family protein [Nitrospinae bacterium]|nr:YfiR family protein [Nitrospinota bacterium]